MKKIIKRTKLIISLFLISLLSLASGGPCGTGNESEKSNCTNDERCYSYEDGEFYSLNNEDPCPCAL